MSFQSERKSTFQIPRVSQQSHSRPTGLGDFLDDSQFKILPSQQYGRSQLVPEAPSCSTDQFKYEKRVPLSQSNQRTKPRFLAPVSNKSSFDIPSQFTDTDLTLSQMLESPPRSQSINLNVKNHEYDESQRCDYFRTPIPQTQNSSTRKRFKPPINNNSSQQPTSSQNITARKLNYTSQQKQLSKTDIFKTDFSFENVPQAQPFLVQNKTKTPDNLKQQANHANVKRPYLSQTQTRADLSPVTRQPPVYTNQYPRNAVPEAPAVTDNLFSDADQTFQDFTVSQAIKRTQTERFKADTPDLRRSSNSQMSRVRGQSNEDELYNYDNSRTPAKRPRHTVDNLYTPATLKLPGGVSKLRSIEEIPTEFRDIFEFPYFNIIQSMVFDDVYYTDKSMVVSAPTGAGKTVIFEIAIVRMLFNIHLHTNGKIVYMAPIKALCSERYNDWNEKFGSHGLICKELTGDTESDDLQELQDANLIMTTPEKWDSMSRKWKDNKFLFHTISLFLVDEIHILNDQNRGATVEAVLSRMKTLILADKKTDKIPMRFIGVSATIPNITDLAQWLGTSDVPALDFKLQESYRPVKLQKIVLGYLHKEGESEFKFDINLTYKLKNIIDTYSNGRPTLVFCSSRKMVSQTGDVLLKQNYGRSYARRDDKDFLKQESLKLRETKVGDLVANGIGIHHAGMDGHDRHSIEQLFRQGCLPILVATSTLAMGVNLPAHLVILKSTTFYSMGCPTEYPDTQILQMIGRAGRPQFDTTATAVIMTKTSSKSKYEAVVNGTQTIESSLHKNLIEHLNAEIVLHTITDLALAVEWIRHTFLYVRIMKNPSHYGVPLGLDRKQVEKRLEDLCLKSVNALAELNLVKMNEETLEIESTETGRLMARYCIAFNTMKKFHDVQGEETIEQLLTLATGCAEFQDITLRQTERTALNTLNKDKNKENIRYPMTGKIKNTQMKVNCLVQASFGCLPVHDYALTNDLSKIFRAGQRVVRCMLEFLWQRKDYKALLTAVQLSKCFKQRLWEDSRYVTKQLDKIGTTISLALANSGLTSFHKLGETNPREIELIANRHPPFGNQVKEAVASLPKYELAIEQVKNYKASTAELIISINMMNKDILLSKPTPFHQAYFIIGDTNNNIAFKWRIVDSILLKEDGWRRKIEVKRCDSGSNLFVHLLSQEWVGVDIHTVYTPVYTVDQHTTSYHNSNTAKQQKSGTPTTGQGLPTCAHRCVNKMLCAHKCCKDGVAGKRQPKTPKVSTKVNERGLDAQIKHLKNRAQDFPQTPSDIKRSRIGVNNLQMSSLNLQKFAYTNKIGTSRNSCNNSNINIQNQGNFNVELSPVVEDDEEICYSPNANQSVCSIDEFEPVSTSISSKPVVRQEDIAYWDPGFSSDEDMVRLEDDNMRQTSVIIGKVPNTCIPSHSRNDNLVIGQRTSDDTSRGVDNLYSNLESDSDSEIVNININDVEVDLPDLNYTRNVDREYNHNPSNLRHNYLKDGPQSFRQKPAFNINDDHDINFSTETRQNLQTKNQFQFKQKDNLLHSEINSSRYQMDSLKMLNKTDQSADKNNLFSKIDEKMNALKKQRKLYSLCQSKSAKDSPTCVSKPNKSFSEIQQELTRKRKGQDLDQIEFSQVIPPITQSVGKKSTNISEAFQDNSCRTNTGRSDGRLSGDEQFRLNSCNTVKQEVKSTKPVGLFRGVQSQNTQTFKNNQSIKPKFNLKSVNYLYSNDDTAQFSKEQLGDQDRVICRSENESDPADLAYDNELLPNQFNNDHMNKTKKWTDQTTREPQNFELRQKQYINMEKLNTCRTQTPSQNEFHQTDYNKYDYPLAHNGNYSPEQVLNLNNKFYDQSRDNERQMNQKQFLKTKIFHKIGKNTLEEDMTSPPRSTEHRYGQVVAWVPDDGNSPRPTTLPLKSPVPPPYLSQSPINNINIEGDIKEDMFEQPSKSLGISTMFCQTIKADDSPSENFSSLFEGIF